MDSPHPADTPGTPPELSRIASVDDALAYSRLTYPAYAGLLLAAAQGERGLAVGAAVEGEPVGLAVAEFRGDTAEIVSLFVASAHRQRGIGTRLLEATERELLAAERQAATLVFPSGTRSTTAAERLLAARGWTMPAPRMHLVTLGTLSLTKVATAPWFRPLVLPQGATIFPWAELPDADRELMQLRQREQPWFPEFLSPFREPERIDAATSIALRRDDDVGEDGEGGEVVGWIVTHRIDPSTLRYTSLFVRPEAPWPRIGWQLLVEAIRRQLAHAAADERATLGIMANSRFWSLVQKRLLPYVAVESIVTTMESRKVLVG